MIWAEGNMSLKNPVATPGIDPGTVRLVAQRSALTTTLPQAPFLLHNFELNRCQQEGNEGVA